MPSTSFVSDIVKSFLSVLKLRALYLFAIAITSGFVLFANDYLLEIFQLKEIAPTVRPFAGVSFLFSCSLIVMLFLNAAVRRLKITARAIRGFLRLHHLTKSEQDILQMFVLGRESTWFYDDVDGDVCNLEHLRIIYKASPWEHQVIGISYGIRYWALRYLKWFPSLLGESRVEQLRHRSW